MSLSHLEVESIMSKEEYVCTIHDKMDLWTTFVLSRLIMENKMVLGLGKLRIIFIGTIFHGHGDEIFAQYNSNKF
jgi:hypothetical protein